MKKIFTVAIATGFAILFTGCISSTVQVNPNPDANTDSYALIKKSEYQRGYRQAIKDNKEKWIKQGFIEAKRALRIYKKDMLAYEAGKYALKEKLITYPRVYAIRNADGSIEVKTLGCQIAPIRNPNTILNFYRKYKSYIQLINDDNSGVGTKKNKSGNKTTIGDINSVGIVSYYDNAKPQISKPNETKTIIKSFTKSYKMKNAIDKYGLNCTVGDTEYICQFDSQAILDEFCKQSGLCSK